MTWQFDHLAFSASEGQVLQDIFSGLLGLVPGHRPPFPFPGRWLYQDQQAIVHVIEEENMQTALSHIAFRTDEDAVAVLKRVKASGLPYQVAHVPSTETLQIFVRMPGGLLIELAAKSG